MASALVSTNPAENYQVLGEVEMSQPEEVITKVRRAQIARSAWRSLGVTKRIELLRPICDEFFARKEEMAQIIVKEIGKPILQTRREAQGYTEDFVWFLENVEEALRDVITYEDDRSLHKIVYEPMGVAAVITPWNFPYGMAIWGIIPNLLAGNTVVFKTSEECPFVGKLIEEIMLNHDLPEGVFAEIYGDGNIGATLANCDVNLIWFTGSSRVGKSLYNTAAGKFIRVVLEMGGSSPAIVFEDANIEQAAKVICKSRFQNGGQVCDGVKRVIAHERIVDELVQQLQNVTASLRVGDPNSEEIDIGSLVAKRQVDLLKEQVNDALVKGAKVIYQLDLPSGLAGAYYPPTILGNVTRDMRVWTDEVFGPVLPIVPFATEQEAIQLANDTQYGLGSRVFSQNQQFAENVALQIQAGTVEINDGDRWILCNPYGGYKGSGIGREHGLLGFRELSQVKVISCSK